MTAIAALGRQRQKDPYEFEVYKASFRIPRAVTQGRHKTDTHIKLTLI